MRVNGASDIFNLLIKKIMAKKKVGGRSDFGYIDNIDVGRESRNPSPPFASP